MTLSDEISSASGDVPFDGDMIVVSRREEAEDIVTLEVALPTADRLPSWDPGAHIDIVLPNGLTRQYSLNGSPEDSWKWRFSVLREPASRGGSDWIHEYAFEGSTLQVRGPRNNFHLEASSRYVFIGGGIGITPLLPMVAAAHGSGAEWTLHYGGRTVAVQLVDPVDLV